MNDIYVLNPQYGLRNDIHRFILFSKPATNGNASVNWASFIHPCHAAMLSLFTHKHSMADNLQRLALTFQRDIPTVEKWIEPFMENTEAFFVKWKGNDICFPAQILIPIEKAGEEYRFQELAPYDTGGITVDTCSRRLYSGPLMLTLMLTNRCMTHCRYCYADTHTQIEKALPTSRILELIREAASLPVQQFNLIGGEVFLHKEWDIILAELVRQGIEPEFLSTKIPFTPECLRKLKETGYRNMIQVSLDAADAEVLSNSLSVDSSYAARMMNGLKLLDKSGLPYQVSTVLTTYNCTSDIVNRLYAFLSTLKNLQDWRLTPAHNSATMDYRNFIDLKPSQHDIGEVYCFLQESVVPYSGFRVTLNKSVLGKSYYSDEGGSRHFNGAACSALNSHLFILPDGKVTICEQLYWNSRFIIGDAGASSLTDIWKSGNAMHLCNLSRNDISRNSKCHDCSCFEECFGYGNRCWSNIVKAYGKECWDYPDPRCCRAPQMTNRLDY